MKNSDIFHVSAQNIDCGYSLEPPRRGSNEYQQFMFLSRNMKNNVLLYKSGVLGGHDYIGMFSPWLRRADLFERRF